MVTIQKSSWPLSPSNSCVHAPAVLGIHSSGSFISRRRISASHSSSLVIKVYFIKEGNQCRPPQYSITDILNPLLNLLQVRISFLRRGACIACGACQDGTRILHRDTFLLSDVALHVLKALRAALLSHEFHLI